MTREDLKNYIYNKKWVEEQIHKYIEMRERAYQLTKVVDGMPKAQNKPNYTIEDLVDQFNEIIEVIYKEQEKLNKIIKQLNELKPLYRNILYYRYIEGKDLEEISTEIGYNYYKICRLNGEALDEFDKKEKEGKKEQESAKKM